MACREPRGISGDTTRGILIRLAGDVIALRPGGVVLLAGTNDLEEEADPETVAANMGHILATLRRAGPTARSRRAKAAIPDLTLVETGRSSPTSAATRSPPSSRTSCTRTRPGIGHRERADAFRPVLSRFGPRSPGH